MENKLNSNSGNKPHITGRMTIYKIIKENEKSELYRKNIMKIYNQHPLKDPITQCKINHKQLENLTNPLKQESKCLK